MNSTDLMLHRKFSEIYKNNFYLIPVPLLKTFLFNFLQGFTEFAPLMKTSLILIK